MDPARKAWRKERKELYKRAPKAQKCVNLAKKVATVGTIVMGLYAGVFMYQINRLVESEEFNTFKETMESSQRMYKHLREDPFLMKSLELYVVIRGKVDKDFQYDTWQFLSNVERMEKQQEDLERRMNNLGKVVNPFTSSERPHQPQQYALSRD